MNGHRFSLFISLAWIVMSPSATKILPHSCPRGRQGFCAALWPREFVLARFWPPFTLSRYIVSGWLIGGQDNPASCLLINTHHCGALVFAGYQPNSRRKPLRSRWRAHWLVVLVHA